MRLAALLLALTSAACAPRAIVPDADRERVHTALDGQPRYLRVAVTVHPLFGDGDKLLLLDAPAGEVDLMRSPGGDVIRPPPAVATLPPGTPVRVIEVEFPTPLVVASRVVTTPRWSPWVLLRSGDDPRVHVLVLPQDDATAEALLADAERILSVDDPTGTFHALPPEQQAAILRKEPLDGMGMRAVEMAWGLPWLRRIDRPAGTEEWTWPGGTRRATFSDDRLVRSWKERPAPAPIPVPQPAPQAGPETR